MSKRSTTPDIERLPLWAKVAGADEAGAPTDGMAIIKPGEPGYDDEYAYWQHQAAMGRGVHYAMPDEVEQWDKEQAAHMQEAHRRPAHVLEGTNITISGEPPLSATEQTRQRLGEWMTGYGPDIEGA